MYLLRVECLLVEQRLGGQYNPMHVVSFFLFGSSHLFCGMLHILGPCLDCQRHSLQKTRKTKSEMMKIVAPHPTAGTPEEPERRGGLVIILAIAAHREDMTGIDLEANIPLMQMIQILRIIQGMNPNCLTGMTQRVAAFIGSGISEIGSILRFQTKEMILKTPTIIREGHDMMKMVKMTTSTRVAEIDDGSARGRMMTAEPQEQKMRVSSRGGRSWADEVECGLLTDPAETSNVVQRDEGDETGQEIGDLSDDRLRAEKAFRAATKTMRAKLKSRGKSTGDPEPRPDTTKEEGGNEGMKTSRNLQRTSPLKVTLQTSPTSLKLKVLAREKTCHQFLESLTLRRGSMQFLSNCLCESSS